jgi:hypothetical protein
MIARGSLYFIGQVWSRPAMDTQAGDDGFPAALMPQFG